MLEARRYSKNNAAKLSVSVVVASTIPKTFIVDYLLITGYHTASKPQYESSTMDIIPELEAASQAFKATHDIAAFNTDVEKATQKLYQASDADKAKMFDALVKKATEHLTEMDDLYDGDPNMIYSRGDNVHYFWEDAMKNIYGKRFFDFWNTTYTEG
jgi:hypothetical protein